MASLTEPNSLGRDILGVTDIDVHLTIGTRRRSAAESIVRALFHEPGALWWAPDRGYHIARHLHAFFDAEAIESAVRAQLEADERTESASVVATQLGSELRLEIELVLTRDPTAVTLVVQVSEIGALLSIGA
jgi:hypothetical protein